MLNGVSRRTGRALIWRYGWIAVAWSVVIQAACLLWINQRAEYISPSGGLGWISTATFAVGLAGALGILLFVLGLWLSWDLIFRVRTLSLFSISRFARAAAPVILGVVSLGLSGSAAYSSFVRSAPFAAESSAVPGAAVVALVLNVAIVGLLWAFFVADRRHQALQ